VISFCLDDYGSACQKLKAAVESSNIESAAEDTLRPAKRRRTQIGLSCVGGYFGDSGSSSDDEQPHTHTNSNFTPPSLPLLDHEGGKKCPRLFSSVISMKS
jgi:hypothetical protein